MDKIVQFQVMPHPDGYYDIIYVLTEEGRMYKYEYGLGGWSLIPGPQPRVPSQGPKHLLP
ncbi:MAG: hypothetical protein WAU02_01460 [Candidatus Saccharimonadales bacterium]